jgi:RNA polymerase sigma factor (sigma-70 family)
VDELLNILAKKHKFWVNFARKYAPPNLAEDIVQDSYIRIHKYTNPNQLKNKHEKQVEGYVCRVIITVASETYKDGCRRQEKIKAYQYPYEEIKGQHKALNTIYDKINEALNELHWYDKMLFNLYRHDNLSIRELSKKTGISVTSIFQTLKKVKTHLKNKVGEDYQDYKNGDYELI